MVGMKIRSYTEDGLFPKIYNEKTINNENIIQKSI